MQSGTGRHRCAGATGPGRGRGVDRGRALATRAVGVYFAGSGALNAGYTLRHAHRVMSWFRDSAWLRPYRAVLGALEPAAPAVVVATVVFEAVVGYHLLRLRRISAALRWAQAWVLGLVPALPWPYWVPNAVSAVAFEAVRRRSPVRGPGAR